MSWISGQQTSRVEDIAYCLFGIFDINMPLLYGEGRKAFLRLELEILRNSDDESIFAWTSKRSQYGLLALWPDSFEGSAHILRHECFVRPPYSMTNKGLEFNVHEHELPMVRLNCCKRSESSIVFIMIELEVIGVEWMASHFSNTGTALSMRLLSLMIKGHQSRRSSLIWQQGGIRFQSNSTNSLKTVSRDFASITWLLISDLVSI